MLSSRLSAFVIPTSQKSATTTPEDVVRDELDAEPGRDRDPGGAELDGELCQRAQVVDVVDHPGDEQDPGPGEDPRELPGCIDGADGHRERRPRGEAGGDADAAEGGRHAVVPALTGGDRDEPPGDGRRAKQGPEDEGRDGQRGDRDGCAHGS